MVREEPHPVADQRLGPVDFYKTSVLSLISRGSANASASSPCFGVPPKLEKAGRSDSRKDLPHGVRLPDPTVLGGDQVLIQLAGDLA